MESSGGKLKIHGYGSITYRVKIDDGSKVTIKVNNQTFVPYFKFHLIATQQIATDEKNNRLTEHEQTNMTINASSSVLLLEKRTKTKTIMYRQEMSIPLMKGNIGFYFSRILTKRLTLLSTPGACMIFQPPETKSRSKMTTMIYP